MTRVYAFAILAQLLITSLLADDRTVTELEVDTVWVANQVGFSLQTVGHRQYVAYYDRDRMMTVAARNLGNDQWQKTTLPNKLMWDSHNSVALAVDGAGFVHVSGNMHTHPLCYFRSEKPHDITNMVAQHRMLGMDEESVTYPRFFSDNQGRLLFSYRSGTCGNGNILVNRFEPKKERWVRHIDKSLFEGIEADDNRAAYHRFVRDKQGNFHFVWMWRWTPEVETCHQLCYATTPDLIHWRNAAGQPLELPLRPDMQATIVDDVPSKGGLHNSRYQIILDSNARPIIGYVKYDDQGLTQLYVARPDNFNGSGHQWTIRQLSDWDFRWKFIEGGDQMSEGGTFQFASITDENMLVIPWSTETGRKGRYTIDANTLQPVTTSASIAPEFPPSVRERMTNRNDFRVNIVEDKAGVQADGSQYILKWESKGKSHGRHAPDIIPDGPLSRLLLMKVDANKAQPTNAIPSR